MQCGAKLFTHSLHAITCINNARPNGTVIIRYPEGGQNLVLTIDDVVQHLAEKELDKIVVATKRARRPLRGQDKIGIRVGKVINRRKSKL